MSVRVLNVLERGAGCVLLAAAAPLIAAAAAVIAILSRRSPLVAHLRVGQHGKALWMLKLRTMWSAGSNLPAEVRLVQRIVAEPAADYKDRADTRVGHPFAAFCRRHSIDELPQLWHVARGEMSLVGPRPLTASELAKHYGTLVPSLLSVKPGMTGIWQTNGRSALDWQVRVSLDLDHLRKRSARDYVAILYRTFPVVIGGRGAW